MPFEIKRLNKGYQVINKSNGHTFSKKPLTEKNAIKQFNILNKYLNTLEGSGLNKGEVKELSEEPLTDSDIKSYLPNVKIISHQDLKNYKTIDELLPRTFGLVIIIYEAKPNEGHWTLLTKYIDEETNKPTIEYFDSYGNTIDTPLKWIQDKSIDSTPYLTKLLTNAKNKYDIIYNSKDFQKENKNIATCGRHCISRASSILKHNQSLSNYIKMMNSINDMTGFNYDNIVSNIIN
jgi:hypothetical protein